MTDDDRDIDRIALQVFAAACQTRVRPTDGYHITVIVHRPNRHWPRAPDWSLMTTLAQQEISDGELVRLFGVIHDASFNEETSG